METDQHSCDQQPKGNRLGLFEYYANVKPDHIKSSKDETDASNKCANLSASLSSKKPAQHRISLVLSPVKRAQLPVIDNT